MEDLTTLSDQELNERLDAYLSERERRESLRSIPGQMSSLTRAYAAAGGDPADLITALDTGGQNDG